MGNKDSKASVLPYEEAVKRVTDDELKRLREAFKRAATLSGYMNKQMFVREVLGEGVPAKLADLIFGAFGGNTKGLTFKDLFCGLVLLTRGRREEKIKFVYGIYSNDSSGLVHREDLESLIQASDSHLPQSLSTLFFDSDKVTYEQFRHWVAGNLDATTLTRWLLQDGGAMGIRLSDESDTPTFYQTLAGVTHLEEADIIELEKRYWQLKAQSKTGRFDLETFIPMICPPVPRNLCEGLFYAFDENRDNHIDFKEMACGLSACCRGPVAERQKFCFKIFDKDHDGLLSRKELEAMVSVLLEVKKENQPKSKQETDTLQDAYENTGSLVDDILATHDGDNDSGITLEEYQIWSVNSKLPVEFLSLLFQICHIVLGLRPTTRQEEGDVVLGWVDRENRRGLQQAQTWYLVSMQWWKAWKDYVTYKPNSSQILSAQSKSKSLPRKAASTQSNQAWSNDAGKSSQPSSPRETSSTQSGASTPSGSPRKVVSNHHTTQLQEVTQYGRSPVHTVKRNSQPAVSTIQQMPPKPGTIDNTLLIIQETRKVMMLTNEGGRLKRNTTLARERDFEILPDPVWKALMTWYGGQPALPRNVIIPSNGDPSPELELYPISVRLLRHQANQPKQNAWNSVSMGIVGGFTFGAGSYVGSSSHANNTPAPPKRYLAYVAAFSRMHTIQQVYDFLCQRLRIRNEDMRLWNLKDENNPVLLEEENTTLEQLAIIDNQQLLIEVRNKDMSWPEEMSSLAIKKGLDKKKQVPTDKGATGLSNLGNTCFMNSALQCISNTRPLTQYFNENMHLYEFNRSNPLGMKGHIAKRYGDLVQDLWSGTSKSLAPLKLRWTIGKYAPRFNGFQQHDSQEFLAFLLDGLHEDLNRVHDKPYVELKDSNGRPDQEVATEAWDNHMVRNRSVIVDLFHGQLKSQVRCTACGHESVRFDPFTYLSLPLPLDSSMHLEIIVIRLDGSVPNKYGLRLNMEDKYKDLKNHLSELCNLTSQQILLVEVFGAMIKSLPSDNQKVRTALVGYLYAYEIPPPPQLTVPTQTKPVSSEKPTQVSSNGDQPHVDPLPPVNGTTPSDYDSVGENSTTTSNKPGGLHRTQKINANVMATTDGNDKSSQSSSSSMSNGTGGLHTTPYLGNAFDGFVIAMHRKMIRMDVYFLSSQKTRPSLFGTPLILPCTVATRQSDLYKAVWTQVSRLVSPLPPSENGANVKNHAEDCDDSMGYEYPFVLKAVQRDGITCAWCPWYRFCRGCKIDCVDDDFAVGSAYIAIDWDPTALHLRYQSSQERVVEDHESVEESRRLQTEPIDLDTCLQAFTKEEELGEDELWYCSKCKEHRQATKKLALWRLPPILIVHMKRFQYVNGRWVKSQKIVKFPKKQFDPSRFLSSNASTCLHSHTQYVMDRGAPREKTANGVAVQAVNNNGTGLDPLNAMKDSREGSRQATPEGSRKSSADSLRVDRPAKDSPKSKRKRKNSISPLPIRKHNSVSPLPGKKESAESVLSREGRSSVGSANSHCSSDASHENGGTLSPDAIKLDKKDSLNSPRESTNASTETEKNEPDKPFYNLFALSCHTGILGGGHYVAYAVNPNKHWYVYNDSTCKEIKEDHIDTDNAYMLFYERQGLDYAHFQPDVGDKEPDNSSIDDEFDNDFKRACRIQ